jgi:hypothetical protein
MRTAIFTSQSTTLFIVTRENASVEQMGPDGRTAADPIRLGAGDNKVPVGPGVFRILSKNPVSVTTDVADLHVFSTPRAANKDDDFPDVAAGSLLGVSSDALRAFFGARNAPAPQ